MMSTGFDQFLVEMSNDPNLIKKPASTPSPARVPSLAGARDGIIPPAVAELAAARLPPLAAVRGQAGGHHLLLSDLPARQFRVDVLAFLAEDLKGAKSTVVCSQRHQR